MQQAERFKISTAVKSERATAREKGRSLPFFSNPTASKRSSDNKPKRINSVQLEGYFLPKTLALSTNQRKAKQKLQPNLL
jgi:hypothetical protein